MASSDIGIVVLAAGASSRLGKPKQALAYNGKSLLTHAINVAVESSAGQVISVLGANADQLIAEASQKGVKVLINEQWQEGMASSIRIGLSELLAVDPEIKAVIFMVCDQPFVTATLLKELITEYHSCGKPIIACTYGDSVGTPALFDKTIFASLLELEGDNGAKKIIKAAPELVSTVSFPKGNIDIDTMADYDELVSISPELAVSDDNIFKI